MSSYFILFWATTLAGMYRAGLWEHKIGLLSSRSLCCGRRMIHVMEIRIWRMLQVWCSPEISVSLTFTSAALAAATKYPRLLVGYYSLTVMEAGSPNSKCWQGHPLSEPLGKDPSTHLPAPGSSRPTWLGRPNAALCLQGYHSMSSLHVCLLFL